VNKLYIIKLGGAAITDKNSDFTAKQEVIKRVMKELKSVTSHWILIHGAGSFAHSLAKKYDLRDGISNKIQRQEQIQGVSKIRNSMQRLHQMILDEAEINGTPTFSFPISSILVSSGNDSEASFYVEPIRRALRSGFIPVSFGDMVLDSSTDEFRVVSGDRIIKLLCRELSSEYEIEVIFGSNVDGLYDRDPVVEEAKLLNYITKERVLEHIEGAGASAGIDVTGGMVGKLLEINELTQFAKKVTLLNLLKEGRLEDYLKGEQVTATIIE
jgi:isopentenyl phosphate kinase